MAHRTVWFDDCATSEMYYIGGRCVGMQEPGGGHIYVFESEDIAKDFFEDGGIFWGKMTHKFIMDFKVDPNTNNLRQLEDFYEQKLLETENNLEYIKKNLKDEIKNKK